MRKISTTRMLVIVGLYSLFANFAHPITPTVIQNLGLHDYMFGVAFAAMSLTNFLFSPFWGKLSTRYGSAKVASFCFVGYGIGQFMFMVATTEFTIVLARLVSGLFTGGVMVNQLIYLMENSPLDKRAQNLAYNATIMAVVSAFGFLVGGYLGDISIELAFMAQVIGLVAVGFINWLALADKEAESVEPFAEIIKQSNPFKVVVDAKHLINSFLIVFFIVTITTSFASTCYEQCFNYFIKDQYNFPPSYNGLLKAVVGFITLAANSTICMWLLRKTDIKKSLVYVLVVCFAMMVSIVLVQDMFTFIVINVVFFGFNAVYLPLIQAVLAEISKKDSGVLVGLFNSMRSLGMVLGSLFAGFIYAVGPRMSFVSAAIAFAIAIVAAYINYRQSKRTEIDLS